ncbi:MAG: DUF4446 family protein [Actinomycetia bacterium]|nr:DUF4446 family protein [Actinomycetes bacterium]
MNVALIIAVLLAVILAIWQTIQIQAIRRRVDAVPEDGNVIGMLQTLDARTNAIQAMLDQMQGRVESIEGRLPFAISHVGVVAYNAYGNITGNRSRSIALMNQLGDGLVISLLSSREETMFYTKEVRKGVGVEELSPEEMAAVDRAMGR